MPQPKLIVSFPLSKLFLILNFRQCKTQPRLRHRFLLNTTLKSIILGKDDSDRSIVVTQEKSFNHPPFGFTSEYN